MNTMIPVEQLALIIRNVVIWIVVIGYIAMAVLLYFHVKNLDKP